MIALIDQYRSCLLELYYDLNIFMTIFELFAVSSNNAISQKNIKK